MMRTYYQITIKFTYNNGTPNGVLNTTVNSRKAVDTQLAASRTWLAAKGHTINSVDVKPL